jgi:two-component system copper resistance phosphate regulon response regulator CusR
MKVLLIEDDEIISRELTKALTRSGWIVEARLDGDSGYEEALFGTWGLIILDVMLPGKDGWEICEGLRNAGVTTPILMLTARDDVPDRVKGLNLGADDYLVKPFDFAELEARMHALARRESARKESVLHVDDLSLDTGTHTAARAGKQLSLTPREHELLEALMRNAGQVLTREAILERVWNAEEALPNTVNFHVSSLRKKVDAPGQTQLIHTVHGLGYRLTSHES